MSGCLRTFAPTASTQATTMQMAMSLMIL